MSANWLVSLSGKRYFVYQAASLRTTKTLRHLSSASQAPPDASMPTQDHSVDLEDHLLPYDGVVYTVPRAAEPSLHSRTRVSIPQTIWQTARSHQNTPLLATDLFNSWTKHNEGYDHFFLDDSDVVEIVKAHYNSSVVQAFIEMPLGVMRADAVRCAAPSMLFRCRF